MFLSPAVYMWHKNNKPSGDEEAGDIGLRLDRLMIQCVRKALPVSFRIAKCNINKKKQKYFLKMSSDMH